MVGPVASSFDFFFLLVFCFLMGSGSVSESVRGLISGMSKISGMHITGGSVCVSIVAKFFCSCLIFGGRVCVSLL